MPHDGAAGQLLERHVGVGQPRLIGPPSHGSLRAMLR